MKQNKTFRSGSLLLEVIIALAVIGTLLSAIIILQTNLYKRFIVNKKRAEVLFLVKPLMVKKAINLEQVNEKEKSETEALQDFSYTVENVPVADDDLIRFKNLMQKKVMFTPSGYYYLMHATKPLPEKKEERK